MSSSAVGVRPFRPLWQRALPPHSAVIRVRKIHFRLASCFLLKDWGFDAGGLGTSLPTSTGHARARREVGRLILQAPSIVPTPRFPEMRFGKRYTSRRSFQSRLKTGAPSTEGCSRECLRLHLGHSTHGAGCFCGWWGEMVLNGRCAGVVG